jgi:hypothetical protein
MGRGGRLARTAAVAAAVLGLPRPYYGSRAWFRLRYSHAKRPCEHTRSRGRTPEEDRRGIAWPQDGNAERRDAPQDLRGADWPATRAGAPRGRSGRSARKPRQDRRVGRRGLGAPPGRGRAGDPGLLPFARHRAAAARQRQYAPLCRVRSSGPALVSGSRNRWHRPDGALPAVVPEVSLGLRPGGRTVYGNQGAREALTDRRAGLEQAYARGTARYRPQGVGDKAPESGAPKCGT